MKRTILFINGHLEAGGCERSLTDVLKNINYDKYEVDLLLLERRGDYLEEIPQEVNIKLLLTLANYSKGITTSSGNSYLCSIRFKTKKLCIETC